MTAAFDVSSEHPQSSSSLSHLLSCPPWGSVLAASTCTVSGSFSPLCWSDNTLAAGLSQAELPLRCTKRRTPISLVLYSITKKPCEYNVSGLEPFQCPSLLACGTGAQGLFISVCLLWHLFSASFNAWSHLPSATKRCTAHSRWI